MLAQFIDEASPPGQPAIGGALSGGAGVKLPFCGGCVENTQERLAFNALRRCKQLIEIRQEGGSKSMRSPSYPE